MVYQMVRHARKLMNVFSKKYILNRGITGDCYIITGFLFFMIS